MHSVWIDATKWKFDNHTKAWKESDHNLFANFPMGLGGSEAAIVVFCPVEMAIGFQ